MPAFCDESDHFFRIIYWRAETMKLFHNHFPEIERRRDREKEKHVDDDDDDININGFAVHFHE